MKTGEVDPEEEEEEDVVSKVETVGEVLQKGRRKLDGRCGEYLFLNGTRQTQPDITESCHILWFFPSA